MAKTPLVTIVTPSYNQGMFIKETIESVLTQDYSKIEYIVVDGGSTDNTVDILKKYSNKLKWSSEPDSGQTDAIAKGFDSSTGEILAYINSDDVYVEGAVARVVEFFEENPDVGMVYGKGYYIDEGGRVEGEYPTEEFDMKKLASLNFISQPSAFFTRKAYIDAGGLDRSLSYVMDYDLWIRLAGSTKVEYLPEYLSKYRLHSGSKTVADRNAFDNCRETLETVRKYYGWAPATRVYAYCWFLVKLKAPAVVVRVPFLMVPLTVVVAFFKYIWLNKGIRREDVRALSFENLKKMALGRIGFYR